MAEHSVHGEVMRSSPLAASTTTVFGCDDSTTAAPARFRALIHEHGDFVWRSLRRLGICKADLADAAQQVFLTASRKLELIRQGSERSFLFQTAVRVAANARRMRQRRREVSEEACVEPPDPSPGPEPCWRWDC